MKTAIFTTQVNTHSEVIMFRVDNDNKIYLTRGDTAVLNLVIDAVINGKEYEVSENDKAIFTAKKGESVLRIEAADATTVNFTPELTKDLKAGTYDYDVRLLTSSGDVFTVIGPAQFYLIEEIGNVNSESEN